MQRNNVGAVHASLDGGAVNNQGVDYEYVG